jgi:hypothetical protein
MRWVGDGRLRMRASFRLALWRAGLQWFGLTSESDEKRYQWLIGEETRLGGGGCGGFAAGYADNTKNREFAQCGAGNEDSVGARVQVGRGDVEAIVEKTEQVVRDDAFQSVTIDKAKPHPQPVQFGPAEERFPFGLEVVGKFANEINRADFGERDFFVLAIWGEQVDGVGLP